MCVERRREQLAFFSKLSLRRHRSCYRLRICFILFSSLAFCVAHVRSASPLSVACCADFSIRKFLFCESLCLCETYYLLLLAVVPVNHDEVDEEVFVPGSSLLAFFLHLVIVLVVAMIVRSRRRREFLVKNGGNKEGRRVVFFS